ncbi:hypothetical protein E1258_14980 [Micromonospora sp. KC207]|uniref:hypothetical protein n=1 Tax=Micromonospora sp. KC207 TaxID=2530377 RepID=UPI00104AA5BB|nr:hypothetical protein [Micromonospora sp. KC207]TDC60341.1 hypothetical protein E1258_14980 [Micromonospora sp. KC207]
MPVWSELCAIARWLLRQPDPPPPPGTGQAIQAAEQAAARRQLLGLAEAERLRNSRWHSEPTQPNAYQPLTLGQRTGYQVRYDR